MEAPVVNIGILTKKNVSFILNDEYIHVETASFLKGKQRAVWRNGKILFRSKLYTELFFEPTNKTASFDLKEVTIGVDFHWQRKEDQRFRGALNLIAGADGIIVINQLDIEEYLTSVISSEMRATASKEFLKAHAVISRSWLLAQIEKNSRLANKKNYKSSFQDEEQLIKWYDREDHAIFDVCADDHCQRYQGITRASTPIVEEVISETRGEILMSDSTICDTRFSKCCGGVTEKFEHCWEPIPHTYLTTVRDHTEKNVPDLTNEKEADQWIRTSPEAFCHTTDKSILSQVLNNYDQETTDFYRWQITYTQDELARLIHRKTGYNFGKILDLIPLKRGGSGRIEQLQIVGSLLTYTIGKELEIRRSLSESHLYSSAFVVDKGELINGIPSRFTLTGAGWGHGVGLCQIGAAVMGTKGYNYKQILSHYYQGATIEKHY
ncbi:SpoIID/LytB domain-containing protein [Parabacteroides sp. PF5-9]|uniref:SpoIID/LytB domain-containing protein n=1 Tax=Parabacteroides sp. PF5-9 TaxID=1742404 RepID=UPI00247653C3|nr:SpoIID/LytB domain-containing protein [Parabacteroides sp. PF5-9]MDH6358777.1 stage II sporulation protein D [Parabacteroides sp. PF5-9]